METSHSSTKLTYSDYLRLPDDALRHEIIDGVHFVTPSPVTKHQRISRDLLYLLTQYLREHPIGEVFVAPFDVVLSEFDIVVPDLLYLSTDRARFLTSKNLQGPPDLVIEILSPGTRGRDRQIKRDLYERTGVREYWLVDPDRDVVTVYRTDDRNRFGPFLECSAARRDVVTTTLLPGFSLDLQQLFTVARVDR